MNITLQKFLCEEKVTATFGQAKKLISNGKVCVNGNIANDCCYFVQVDDKVSVFKGLEEFSLTGKSFPLQLEVRTTELGWGK